MEEHKLEICKLTQLVQKKKEVEMVQLIRKHRPKLSATKSVLLQN
jgi:hypothetical protein